MLGKIAQMSEVEIINGDCEIALLGILQKCVVITDPPYGTGTYATDKEPTPTMWGEIRRIGELFAVFGYAKNLMRWQSYFSDLDLLGYIVWHKYNEILISPGLTRAHQDIAIWGNSIKQVHADRVREPYSKNRSLSTWFNGRGHKDDSQLSKRLHATGQRERTDGGRRCTDLWEIAAPGAGFNASARNHPNEKPIDIMKRLMMLLTDEGDTIIDPFMGSGTTGVACVQTGRNFIGIEIDPTYYAIAEKRIAQAQLQIRMPL
jgi:site-specific DNA-methyltransferase (adenine-specific)